MKNRFSELRDALPSWARANSSVYNDNDFLLLEEDIREFLEDTPILIQERIQDSNCLIKLKESVQKSLSATNNDETTEEKLVKEKEEGIEEEVGEKLVKQQEEIFEQERQEELARQKAKEEELAKEKAKEEKRAKRKAKKEEELAKQREKEEEEREEPSKQKEKEEEPPKEKEKKKRAQRKEKKVVNRKKGKLKKENEEDHLDILGKRSTDRLEKIDFSGDTFLFKDSPGGEKEYEFEEEIPEEKECELKKDSPGEKGHELEEEILEEKEYELKKEMPGNQSNDDDPLGGLAELNKLVLESQVIPMNILGKRATDRLEKNDFSEDMFLFKGSQSTKKIKTEFGKENKENQGIAEDLLGGFAGLSKFAPESQAITMNIFGKRTDKFEQNDFYGDFLKGSQSTKKVKTEFENKGNQGKDDAPFEGFAELKKSILEPQVAPLNTLGKRTDEFEKSDFYDHMPILKGSQSTKKIKTEFENLKPSKENHFIENCDVGKYSAGSSTTKSAKESETKSGKKTLQEILCQHFPFKPLENMNFRKENENSKRLFTQVAPLNTLGKRTTDRLDKNDFSDDMFLFKGSQSTKKIKTEFENLKPSKENHFIENSDVDKYFAGSSTTKSAKKSEKKTESENLKWSKENHFVEKNDVDKSFDNSTTKSAKKSGKKTLQEILCQHFPFKPLENISFRKENDSSKKLFLLEGFPHFLK